MLYVAGTLEYKKSSQSVDVHESTEIMGSLSVAWYVILVVIGLAIALTICLALFLWKCIKRRSNAPPSPGRSLPLSLRRYQLWMSVLNF